MRDRLEDIGVAVRDVTGRATALPATAQETAAVVDLARDEGWVVAPHWLESSADTGSSPVVRVSLERIDGIDEVMPADLMAVAGAGVRVGALEERIAADGMCWPPSATCNEDDMVGDVIARLPGAWTMAGNLARRYLLAIDAVLADGSLIHAGARTVKSVTGYDLKQLLVGSRSTLGVITSLTLRLETAANRESVLERYRRDFAGMEREDDRRGMGTGGGSAGKLVGGDGDGALLILERLKKELDPGDVFPAVGALMQSDPSG